MPDSDNNFCANPDNDAKGNWCYTVDPKKRYEFCQKSCVYGDGTGNLIFSRILTRDESGNPKGLYY